MSEHTPEPWISDVDNWLSVVDGSNDLFGALICQVNGKKRPEADANRLRIVACVNTFEGIPTEAITSGLMKTIRGIISWMAQFDCECEEIGEFPCVPCEARAFLKQIGKE